MSSKVSFFRELGDGLRQRELWWEFAVEELRNRFRRTAIGLAWISISFAAFVGVKVFVFRLLTDVPFEIFSMHLLIGFMIWQFINGLVVDGTNVFVSSENWIKGVKLPYSIYVFKSVARNTLTFLLTLIVGIIFSFFLGSQITITSITLFPAIFVYIVCGVLVQFVVGAICTRFRDFTQIIQTFMRIMFFVTPVLWLPQNETLQMVALWNPFAHFIEIFRAPILYGRVETLSWIVVGAIFLALLAMAAIAFRVSRNRIVFWL